MNMVGLIFKKLFLYKSNRKLHVNVVLEIQRLNFLYLFVCLADLIMCWFFFRISLSFNVYNLVDNYIRLWLAVEKVF